MFRKILDKLDTVESKKPLNESVQLGEGLYWDSKGKHQELADKYEKLVPDYDKADTLKGEIMRAASSIYYDYYNNGFGNEWQPAAQFLMNHVKELDPSIKAMLMDYGGGNTTGDYELQRMKGVIEQMMDTVLLHLEKMEDQPNETDMWDTSFDEEDFPSDMDSEDDDDYHYGDDYDDEEEDFEESQVQENDDFTDFLKSIGRGRR